MLKPLIMADGPNSQFKEQYSQNQTLKSFHSGVTGGLDGFASPVGSPSVRNGEGGVKVPAGGIG